MKKWKNYLCIFMVSFVALFFSSSFLYAKQINRIASITDINGVSYKVENIKVPFYFALHSIQNRQNNSLIIWTEKFNICIPLSSIISMEKTDRKQGNYSKGDIYKVTYLIDDRQETIFGGLHEISAGVPRLNGKTKVGDLLADFNLGVYKLKKMTFPSGSASPIKSNTNNTNKAIIHFLDDQKILVANLSTYYHYHTTKGYIVGGKTRHVFETSFGVGKGAARAVLQFNQIDKIIFHPVEKKAFAKNKITVKSVKGIEYPSESTGYTTFTGIFSGGQFSVSSKYIKEIDFVHNK